MSDIKRVSHERRGYERREGLSGFVPFIPLETRVLVKKVMQSVHQIVALYCSRDLLVCLSELRRVVCASCLARSSSVRAWSIDLPTTYAPHNASILRNGEDWVVAIRGGPSAVDSETWIVRLDKHFRFLERAILWDAPYRNPAGAAKNGLTDPRIFLWQRQLWSLWSAERVVGNDWSDTRNTMAIGLINGDEIEQLTLISSPRGSRREKNWMPWVLREELRFIYSISTMEIYRVVKGGRLELLNVSKTREPRLAGYSGSSQVQAWGSDWICVVHHAARAARVASGMLLPVYYLHRFVIFSEKFEVKAVSREFFLEHKGTEFCAGLAVEKEFCLLSYGLRDLESRLMRIPLDAVEALFVDT
jgi:hypothetical protein